MHFVFFVGSVDDISVPLNSDTRHTSLAMLDQQMMRVDMGQIRQVSTQFPSPITPPPLPIDKTKSMIGTVGDANM